MSTMEHLFMQIFERRDWIAGQLRQQGESYAQSVASNLLAAGGRIPPWLWTAAGGSDGGNTCHPQELNRKQMISEILYTFPSATTPSISHTVFPGEPVQKDVNVPQSKRLDTANSVLNKFCTSVSLPECSLGDNEQQDIVMDSFERIQKSSLEQRDKQVYHGKRRKLNDSLSKQRKDIEYTGRMTRSRTTAMRTPHIKESLDLNSLYEFPAECDDKVTQLRPDIQQQELFQTPSKVAKQIDWSEDRSGKRKPDPQVCSCSAQNKLDNIASTLPPLSMTSVEAEPTIGSIKAGVSNEKFGTCSEMKQQNISSVSSMIKLGATLSVYREKSICNSKGTDDSSMAEELQDKLNDTEAMSIGEYGAGRVVTECQEKGLQSVEKTEIRCDIVSCGRRSSHASSLSFVEHLHENAIAYTSSLDDGTLNYFSEFLDLDDSKQDDNGNRLLEIQTPHKMEQEDIETHRAEATDMHAGGSETNSILLEAKETQNDALEVAASQCTPPPSDAIVCNEHLETQNCQKSPTPAHSFKKDSLLDKSETFSVQSPIMENILIFDDPNLQQLTRDRATALEQLRCSMSIPAPFSCFSTKYRMPRVPDICQSLPSELFEPLNLDDHLQLTDTDKNDHGSAKDGNLADTHWNMVANFDSPLLGRLVSHSMPSFNNLFSYNVSRAPCTPLVEKFPQSHFLERKGCGIDGIGPYPELTCFRIDENARSLEENMPMDEFQDSPNDRLGSSERGFLSARKALADVSSIYQNAPAIGSKAEEGLDRGIFGVVKTETSFFSKMNDKHHCLSNTKSKVENKENEPLSMSENKVQKVVASLHNRQDMESVKGDEQKRSQSILEKKTSNILSNISSFVPLVKQKQQTAGPITGKREIKVKALEAAETAKRLAEKKENERRMKKEAARLERIKLDQENARQLELKQKQKEEERKKKEANIAAKKRQREEERKDKQRKRNCTEGAQQQRKGFEGRVRAEKVLQYKATDEKEHKRKELAEGSGMQQKVDERQNVAEVVKLTEADQDTTAIAKVVENDNNSLQFYGVHKDSTASHKVMRSSSELQQTMPDKIVMLKESRQSQSYEISPYRSSDDEDGDDDKRHKKKFIPLWARGESLNEQLLSQRHVDAAKLFCRKSSFDLKEVSIRTRQRAF